MAIFASRLVLILITATSAENILTNTIHTVLHTEVTTCITNYKQFQPSPLVIQPRIHMSRLVGKPTMWFSNRSDTNRAVQAQKSARSLKFWIYKVEELYYPFSENKGADQLRGYREADLRLCLRLCRLLVFPRGGSYTNTDLLSANCNFSETPQKNITKSPFCIPKVLKSATKILKIG